MNDYESATSSFSLPTQDPNYSIYSQLSSRFFLGLIIMEVFLASAVTVGNSLLLVVIYRDPLRCLRTPTTYLTANLGLADCLVGTFLGYSRAVENSFFLKGGIGPKVFNIAQYAIAGAAMFVIIFSIIAMAWDRYVAVADPFNYSTRITVRRVKICILGIWLNALVLTVLPLAGVRKLTFLFVYCYSHFFVPGIVLTVVYISIFKTLSRKLQTLNQALGSENSVREGRSLKREHRLTVTIVLVLISFYACFLPYFVKVHIWLLCGCEKSPIFLVFHFITNDILILFSLIDPVIYAWRLESFRKSFRSVLWFKRSVAPAVKQGSLALTTETTTAII